MAVKKILNVNNNDELKKLTSKASDVNIKEINSPEIQLVIQDLLDTAQANEAKCAGLAAPQLGHMKRIFLANKFETDTETGASKKTETYIFINPKVKPVSKKTYVWWEGCLSIPDVWGLVRRFKKVGIEAYDKQGNKMRIKAEGDFARLIQHENDHLDGVLFTTIVVGKTLTENDLDQRLETL